MHPKHPVNSTGTTTGLRILQWNCQGLRNKRDNLQEALVRDNLDILLLQDTRVNENFSWRLTGYSTYISPNDGDRSGCMIVVKNSIPHHRITNPIMNGIEVETMAVHLKLANMDLQVYNIYRKHQQTLDVEELFTHASGQPCLIAGDMNAHHPIFDNVRPTDHRSDSKGRQLYNLAVRHKLTCLGPYFKTFVASNRRGKPDLIIVNERAKVFQHSASPGENVGSDHIPIIAKFQVKPILQPKPPSLQIRKLNVQQCKEELSTIQNTELNHQPSASIDELTQTLMKQIQTATENNCPTSKVHIIQQYKPTPEIKRLLKKYQEDVMDYYRFKSPTLHELKAALNNIIQLTKQHLTENWEAVTKAAYENYSQPEKFWKDIKNYRGTQTPQQLTLSQ